MHKYIRGPSDGHLNRRFFDSIVERPRDDQIPWSTRARRQPSSHHRPSIDGTPRPTDGSRRTRYDVPTEWTGGGKKLVAGLFSPGRLSPRRGSTTRAGRIRCARAGASSDRQTDASPAQFGVKRGKDRLVDDDDDDGRYV